MSIPLSGPTELLLLLDSTPQLSYNDCDTYYPIVGVYKRALAANHKEQPMKWLQQVSSLVI